ncbi:unnamed protein product [Camellia sinensis]
MNTESCKSDNRREEEKRGLERETGSAAQDFNLERCAPSGSETGSVTTTIDGSKGKGFVLEVDSLPSVAVFHLRYSLVSHVVSAFGVCEWSGIREFWDYRFMDLSMPTFRLAKNEEHGWSCSQGMGNILSTSSLQNAEDEENSASGEHRVHRDGEHRMHSQENIWDGTKMVVDAIDPRLLGEIHVALLRSIIKDIEDVARTPSSIGLGVNQNTAANHLINHLLINPQIVEGAKGVLNKHICNEAATLDQEDMVIDESNSGEPWVQGLMEGEYSDLSVEERLSAVVALIGVANEGNSICIILEERLEAANALKKQMWAEVQLDKRQMKEEYVMKMHRQGPLPTVDDKNGLVSTNLVEQKEHLHDAQNDPNYPIHLPSERNPQIQEVSTCTDNVSLLQPGYAAERSWLQLKAYIGHKVEEMYVYWPLPFGQDRRRNCYWQFITSSSRNDPRSAGFWLSYIMAVGGLLILKSVFIQLLVKPTKAGSSIGVTVADGVTDSLRKANEMISEVELLNLSEYNVHMAKLLDGGRNKAATEFAISLIQTLLINDSKVISKLHNFVDCWLSWKWLAQEDLRMDTVMMSITDC